LSDNYKTSLWLSVKKGSKVVFKIPSLGITNYLTKFRGLIPLPLQAERFGSGSVLRNRSTWAKPKTAFLAKSPSEMSLILNFEF
ncbi:MAG: hypothetical protein ACYT04_51190, partial [Nostoc sp.]